MPNAPARDFGIEGRLQPFQWVRAGAPPQVVALADLDGDSDVDLALIDGGTDTVEVYLNNGTGTFTAWDSIVVGPIAGDLAVGNMDGNNDFDLIVVNSAEDGGTPSISVLANQGDATFATRIDFPAGVMPVAVTLDDFDGDGLDDLAVADGVAENVSVLLNQTQPPFSLDCNANGTPDECDIAGAASDDCDGNGVPDECDPDADGDGTPDACDLCPNDPSKVDPGVCGCGNPDTDTDADTTADCADPDDDNDGVLDAADTNSLDPNVCEDVDADGCDDCAIGTDGFGPLSDNDATNDGTDTDADGICDIGDPCPLDNPDDTDGDTVCDSADICPGFDDKMDGDLDGVPDGCDICPLDNPDDPDGDSVCTSDDNCELFNPGQEDCQGNGIGDTCDIAMDGSLDDNGNGTIDSCELARPDNEDSLGVPCSPDRCSESGLPCDDVSPCPMGQTCLSDCENSAYCIPNSEAGFPGTCYVAKHRSLSIDPNPTNAGIMTARRASIVTGGGPVVLGWVDTPVVEGGLDGTIASGISATPIFRDWSGDGTVHVSDCHISSGRSYLIESTTDGVTFSPPLTLSTTDQWGDVIGGVVSGVATPPQGVANLIDAQQIVKGFQDTSAAPKVWLDLHPVNINRVVNLSDAQQAVKGFQGKTFFDMPDAIDPCSCAVLTPCP